MFLATDHDWTSMGRGLVLFAVGSLADSHTLQLIGLVIGGASVLIAVSKEVRAWLDRK